MDKKRKNIMICVAIAVIVVLTVLLLVLLGKNDSYRIIKIHEFSGDATVTRVDVGEMKPYANMLLESGDTVFLDTGNMTLKMDEDKYAYVEEQTEFVVRAEGTSEDSKTTITINKGSITNEIQNTLSSDASYEVNTQNSTMAVRGTIFRVSTYHDADGVCYTRVSVFDGEVTSRLVYPDGTVSQDAVSIPAGKEVVIYENEKTTDYLTEVRDIDYSTLPEGVVALTGKLLGNSSDITTTEGNQNADEHSEGYVVTFMYGNTIFATQRVIKGQCATVPSLAPAMYGDWNFDFSTVITEDTVVYWKQ